MNRVVNLLESRLATRSIDPAPLEESWIEDLIEAARLTPSCFNNQPWRFLFLLSGEARAKGAAALSEGNRPWAERAPLLVVASAREADDCTMPGRSYHRFDLGLAVMNLMLAATDLGLVARPMAGFSPRKVRESFGLDEQDDPLVVLAIGRPDPDESHLPENARGKGEKPRERKAAAEILTRL